MRTDRYATNIVVRPWGYFNCYAENKKCTVKTLHVLKDQMLSLQYHFKRDQLYYILDDDFIVQYSKIPINPTVSDPEGKEKFMTENMITVHAGEGDIFLFERGKLHRVIYKGDRKYGRVIDVAFGVNDEEDIIRFEDEYGREYDGNSG